MVWPSRDFGGYRLLKPLESGPSGALWLARSTSPVVEGPLVLRIFRSPLGSNVDPDRMHRDVQAVTRTQNPHVPRLVDAGRVDGALYLASEYVPGWTIREVIDELRRSGRTASTAATTEFAAGLCRGLAALHDASDPETGAPRPLMHGDVRPETVLIGRDARPHLLDLGLGPTGVPLWNPPAVDSRAIYAAPEQSRGAAVDGRVDLYALGLVLWELLTLQPYLSEGPVSASLRRRTPLRYRPPSRLRPGLSPAVDALCGQALAAGPSERFRSAAAFEAALRRASPPPAGHVERLLLGLISPSLKTQVTTLDFDTRASNPRSSYLALEPETPDEEHDLDELLGFDDESEGPTLLLEHPPASIRPRSPPSVITDDRHPKPDKGPPVLGVVALAVLTLLGGVGLGAWVFGSRNGTSASSESNAAAGPSPRVTPATVPGASQPEEMHRGGGASSLPRTSTAQP